MKRPPAGQGPFQKGERLTAAKLNDVVQSIKPVRVGGRAGLMGDTIVSDETDSAYIRVTGRTGGKYAWVEVYRTPNGTWANTTRTGNATYDWAVERNNATVSAGSTVYEAKRSVDTSEWIFTQGASGGNVNITSGETVLMILGTYADYDQCPNVPASPPTLVTDYCNQTTGTELCVPAYAYAVYQRCGYVWNKVGDTRTYQVWANELNGGSTGAFRRFHLPRWGGNLTAGVPGTDDDCMGVAFYGGGGTALTCGCPPCLSSSPPGVNLCVKFQTASRPEVHNECGDTVDLFDEEGLWDQEITLNFTTMGCTANADDGRGIPIFNFEWQSIDGPDLECDWGPDVFDPCNPCEHWSRLAASISVSSGPDENCGSAGHWRGEFKAQDICNLLCGCETGPDARNPDPVYATVTSMCNGCGNNVPPIFYFILPETIRIVCCPPGDAFFGGNETSAFTNAYFGGNATSSFSNAIYGGSA